MNQSSFLVSVVYSIADGAAHKEHNGSEREKASNSEAEGYGTTHQVVEILLSYQRLIYFVQLLQYLQRGTTRSEE